LEEFDWVSEGRQGNCLSLSSTPIPICESHRSNTSPFPQVKTIGVSNFTISHLKDIISATGVKPFVNQVEMHPLNPQEELLEFCKKEGIVITAYSPLGNNCEWNLIVQWVEY
jgi:hypothetical protein